MKKYILISFVALFFLPSCRKTNDNPNSGTATINNVLNLDPVLQDYYSLGFLFSAGKLVSSHETPPPDINILSEGIFQNLIFEANNLDNSFYKVGQYSNSATAKNVFDTLVSPVVLQWVEWADSLKANQVWLYKSGNEHYSKLRIVSTVSEIRDYRDYAECTFEWVYQPDGSLTFPGK
jgi:hypothetical protein